MFCLHISCIRDLSFIIGGGWVENRGGGLWKIYGVYEKFSKKGGYLGKIPIFDNFDPPPSDNEWKVPKEEQCIFVSWNGLMLLKDVYKKAGVLEEQTKNILCVKYHKRKRHSSWISTKRRTMHLFLMKWSNVTERCLQKSRLVGWLWIGEQWLSGKI